MEARGPGQTGENSLVPASPPLLKSALRICLRCRHCGGDRRHVVETACSIPVPHVPLNEHNGPLGHRRSLEVSMETQSFPPSGFGAVPSKSRRAQIGLERGTVYTGGYRHYQKRTLPTMTKSVTQDRLGPNHKRKSRPMLALRARMSRYTPESWR